MFTIVAFWSVLYIMQVNGLVVPWWAWFIVVVAVFFDKVPRIKE